MSKRTDERENKKPLRLARQEYRRLLAAAKVALNDVKFHYDPPWNYKTKKSQDTAGILALKAIVESEEVRK